MCARGYCSQCEVTTPEGRTLACQTPPGLRPPTPPTDPLRPLGKVAELFRPWFWERRFLRPRRLRGLFLHALRFLSSAGALGEHAPAGRVRRYEEIEAAVVVVGSDRSHGDAFVVDVENGDVPLGVYPDRTLGLLRGDRLISVRFQKLVLATGSYERLPPIPGSDLPGVLGVDAAEIYGAQGALEAGLRIAGWAPQDQHARIEALAQRHGLRVVWTDVRAPREIHGRRRVEAVVAERRIDCDLFVVGVRQPAIELAMQAGATAELTSGELPILALTSTPDWLEVTGDAARTSSDVPDVAPAARAIVCLCEDVRVSDLEACAAQGFTQTELVKRRTGAMTGPCQGKLCSASVLATLRRLGVDPTPTRSRPLLRPVTLGDLAADA
jgi:bacterioferritin-associated ferredoxin